MATTLPYLQMAWSLSSLKTVVWSPILSAPNVKKKRKKIMYMPGRAYYASFSVLFWEKEKRLWVFRSLLGLRIHITSLYSTTYIWQSLQSSLSTRVSDGVHHMSQSVWHSWGYGLCDVGCDPHMKVSVDHELACDGVFWGGGESLCGGIHTCSFYHLNKMLCSFMFQQVNCSMSNAVSLCAS